MNDWRQDLEAYFGGYRVVVNGVDVGGHWNKEDAMTAASRYANRSYVYSVCVRIHTATKNAVIIDAHRGVCVHPV